MNTGPGSRCRLKIHFEPFVSLIYQSLSLQFQSHQIFHVLVLAAAFVHYHGINTMAAYREQIGECDAGQLFTDTATTVTVEN